MNKPVYLGLSILELSKIKMRVFWYDYVKPKYVEKGKLRYMDTDIGIIVHIYIGICTGFIVYITTDDIYKDIAEDDETRFNNLNYELDRPLPKGKNKNVVGLMNDEI